MKLFLKLLSVLLCICMLVPLVISCGKDDDDDSDAIELSFKSANSYDYLKSINGKKVSINGYIATSSPVNGSFIFLMNMPYQSCPFCVPNTNQLSNTIEAYPKKGEKFSYTASAVKVVGTLAVAPSEDQPFTDSFGYTFNFKIVDSEYTVLKSNEMGANFAVWEKFAQSGIIDELYKMYDYVDFICKWNEYYISPYTDSSGNKQGGYYLYDSDAKNYLEKGDKKYGTDPDYFNNLISRIEAIDKTAFAGLVANIRQAEALAKDAYDKLYNGEYTRSADKIYFEQWGTSDYKYTINGGDQLKSRLDTVYTGFENWLASWEL